MGASSPSARSGLAGMLVALVLLVLPATASSAANVDAGSVVLGVGSGFSRPEGSNEVRLVQRRLLAVGLPAGAVDGLFGRRTELAVRRFQAGRGLLIDGLAGPRTRAALAAALRAPLRFGARGRRVLLVQRRLAARGFGPGRVDGRFGPRTERALRAFQRSRELTVDGIAGPLTLAELARPAGRRGSGAASADRERPARGRARRRPAGSTVVGGAGRPARSAPQRRQRSATTGSPPAEGGGDGGLPGAVATLLGVGLVALAGSLLAGAGLLLVRRGQRGRALVPVSPDTVARGHSHGGRFQGRVHALAVDVSLTGRRRRSEYLVSDPARPAPFWVPLGEISSLSHEPPDSPATRADSERGAEGEARRQANGERQADAEARRSAERERQADADADDELEADGADAGAAGDAQTGARVAADERGLRVVGYATASGRAARLDDPELEAQARALEAFCRRRGWQLAELVRDVDQTPGRGVDRPALGFLLEQLAAGRASCLVVTELERLCRSVAELGDILAALEEAGGRLVALDPELDTASPAGRKAAQTLAAISAWERQRLAERTRKGLAAARARGAVSRPAVEDRPELKRRIIAMRRAGMTLQAIADELNAEGVRTVRGGARWRPSSVQAALGYKRPARSRANGGEDRNGAEEPEM